MSGYTYECNKAPHVEATTCRGCCQHRCGVWGPPQERMGQGTGAVEEGWSEAELEGMKSPWAGVTTPTADQDCEAEQDPVSWGTAEFRY